MSDDEILGDHRWKRTTLVPPFVDSLGDNLEYVRWKTEMVPEILWIGTILEQYGPELTADIVIACADKAKSKFSNGTYILSSDYSDLTESDFEELRADLKSDHLEKIESSLQPLVKHYPDHPQTGLIGDQQEDDPLQDEEIDDQELSQIAELVTELSDRRSKLSMYAQGIYVGTMLMTGELKISKGVEFVDINEVFDYPDTPESRKAGSAVRAAVSSFQGIRSSDDERSDWATKFWERGFELTECIFPHELDEESNREEADQEANIKQPDEELFEKLASFGFEYEESLKHTIIDLWFEAPKDPEFTGKNEVLDGLLMRQVSLVSNLATSPSLWNTDIAGIIIRCMVENQITLEWFNQNGDKEDYKSFIDYGLGQEKLMLEHYQRLQDEIDVPNEIGVGLERMEDRLEAQRYKHLIPVDVGHWADKNTRQLAKEADCKDLYDLRFQQHNPAVHGSWDFIQQNYLVKCHNPLHQFHQIPQFQPLPKLPFAIVEAGNMMNRSLDSWREARGIDQEFEVLDLSESVREILSESESFEDMPL
ncbi:DUF5677 domain-containing protein [Natrinema salinisoli]|uniref:DUF5677 domain-containing protein n=1 Tax=Natrinema salinisoli TaxID=2878535 RepID=UPI001CF01E36|nr:DUF5677 domain-containing protein [Natrinema salinisoli]